MAKQEFYKVDGCHHFVPVKINSLTPHGVDVAVVAKKQPVRALVDQVYQFPAIHEPQKVVVPKFVAEWIEEKKKSGIDLHKSMAYEVKVDVFRYIMDNSETYARAWLDGYEVEQEQLYTVEIPNPVLTDNSDSVTVLTKIDSGVVLTDVVNYIGRKQESVYHLTESEIKQDFEWAWQFAEPVEEVNE